MVLDQAPSKIEKRTEELRMSFGDHLEELRKRIIHALIGVGVCAAITFYFGFQIIAWLAQPMLQAQQAIGDTPQVYSFDPTAGFVSVYMKVSLIAALVIASPWVVYQIWKFIVEGLYEHEKHALHILWPFSLIMTVLGVLFAYYILLPVCFVFFLTWSTHYPIIDTGKPGFMVRLMLGDTEQSGGDNSTTTVASPPLQLPVLTTDPPDLIEGMLWLNSDEGKIKTFYNGQTRVMAVNPNRLLSVYPNLSEYIGFAAVACLGIVIAFQLPVIMMVIGKSGLIDPYLIARFRKYALFACVAASAVLTPTDLFSMIVLAVPLYGLFEFGLALMKWTYPKLQDDD